MGKQGGEGKRKREEKERGERRRTEEGGWPTLVSLAK